MKTTEQIFEKWVDISVDSATELGSDDSLLEPSHAKKDRLKSEIKHQLYDHIDRLNRGYELIIGEISKEIGA